MARKTWAQKMLTRTEPVVETLDKAYAGHPPGAKMLIATPLIVKAYMEAIPPGQAKTVADMRSDLASRYDADVTCPLTASIFARIVAEAALDEQRQGKSLAEIAPFWRLIEPRSPLAKKLSCGPEFVAEQRQRER